MFGNAEISSPGIAAIISAASSAETFSAVGMQLRLKLVEGQIPLKAKFGSSGFVSWE
jgi:hypothetical protein